MAEFIPGLDLSQRFFAEAVEPILSQHFPGLRYASALIGYGSEVLGFDTARSTDHAWGPRLYVFLSVEDSDALSEPINEVLARELPRTFAGWSTSFGPLLPGTNTRLLEDAPGPINHMVVVQELGQTLTDWLGFDPRPGISTAQWLALPTQALLEMTSGRIFRDDFGELKSVRDALAWYPHEVWLYLLACQWRRIAQEEAFVGRCGEVGDELGSAFVGGRLARDIIRLCFLMERHYAPYSKWLGTAFSRLACGPDLIPHLKGVMHATAWQEREAHLGHAYERLAAMHNSLALTPPLDGTLRSFHDRPFQVLLADRYVDALKAQISDKELSPLGKWGAIDQYADSTDLLDYPPAAMRVGTYVVGMFRRRPQEGEGRAD